MNITKQQQTDRYTEQLVVTWGGGGRRREVQDRVENWEV